MIKNHKQLHVDPLRPLIILGAGGHAVSVSNVALSLGHKEIFFLDKKKSGISLLGFKVISDLDGFSNCENLSFVIGIGDNFTREKMHQEWTKKYPTLYFPPLIHPSAVISFFSEVGEGSVIMPNSVVGPNSRIGKFCLINTRASIDHDCVMSDFSSLAPGAVTGGRVDIGYRSAISIGSVIKHGIKIGQDCVLGANSFLNKDLSNNQVAYGSPATKIRMREAGDPYLY